MSRFNAEGQEREKGKRSPRGAWPDGLNPKSFATGQLTLRTIFPAPYDAEVVARRPPYIHRGSDEELARAIQTYFPGLNPRSVFEKSWTRKVYGLSAGQYFASLYNLEGALLRKEEELTEAMISAGLMLICQDLLEDVWFPAAGALSRLGLLEREPAEDARAKRILLIPCKMSIQHWSLTIVDRKEGTAYWYGADDEEHRGRLTRHDLDCWLSRRKLKGSKLKHVRVRSWQPVGVWMNGLLVLEHARGFLREPKKEEDRVGCGWETTELARTKLPLVGRAGREPKLLAKWLIMVYVGWCRMELGVKECLNLRVPIDPVVSLTQYFGQRKNERLPNQKYEKSGWSDEEVNKHLSMLEKGKMKEEEGSVVKAKESTIAFDTWVSGEAGLYLWEFMKVDGEYPYTVFRKGQRSPPLRYIFPMSVPILVELLTDREDSPFESGMSDDGSGEERDEKKVIPIAESSSDSDILFERERGATSHSEDSDDGLFVRQASELATKKAAEKLAEDKKKDEEIASERGKTVLKKKGKENRPMVILEKAKKAERQEKRTVVMTKKRSEQVREEGERKRKRQAQGGEGSQKKKKKESRKEEDDRDEDRGGPWVAYAVGEEAERHLPPHHAADWESWGK